MSLDTQTLQDGQIWTRLPVALNWTLGHLHSSGPERGPRLLVLQSKMPKQGKGSWFYAGSGASNVTLQKLPDLGSSAGNPSFLFNNSFSQILVLCELLVTDLTSVFTI